MPRKERPLSCPPQTPPRRLLGLQEAFSTGSERATPDYAQLRVAQARYLQHRPQQLPMQTNPGTNEIFNSFWTELTLSQESAARSLGWSEENWPQGEAANYWNQPERTWRSMTLAQQMAWTKLGFTSTSWQQFVPPPRRTTRRKPNEKQLFKDDPETDMHTVWTSSDSDSDKLDGSKHAYVKLITKLLNRQIKVSTVWDRPRALNLISLILNEDWSRAWLVMHTLQPRSYSPGLTKEQQTRMGHETKNYTRLMNIMLDAQDWTSDPRNRDATYQETLHQQQLLHHWERTQHSTPGGSSSSGGPN